MQTVCLVLLFRRYFTTDRINDGGLNVFLGGLREQMREYLTCLKTIYICHMSVHHKSSVCGRYIIKTWRKKRDLYGKITEVRMGKKD